jgi:signal transduction histidine kinase
MLMTSRQKHLLTYFLLCLAPLLFGTAINYWYTTTTIDATVGAFAQDSLSTFKVEVTRRIQEAETELTRVSLSKPLQQFARHLENGPALNGTTHSGAQQRATFSTSGIGMPDEIRRPFVALLNGPHHWIRLTLYGHNQRPLLQAEPQAAAGEVGGALFRQNNFAPTAVDNSVFLGKRESQTLNGSTLQLTVPVQNENTPGVSALLVGETNLAETFSDVARVLETIETQDVGRRSILIVLDHKGYILYHSNHLLQGQLVSKATPEFAGIAQAAAANRSGIDSIRTPVGQQLLTAFSPLPRLGIAVVVAHDRSSLILSARRWGVFNLALSGVIALFAAWLLDRYMQTKSKSIERVTEDLSAIAKGELDRRIELGSGDDARVIADNINLVTERLRAQIAREAESRQFESYIRLSAMLSHDLKNAIEALSLTVGNMERHFDNEQFRRDAMKSVTGATEKLKSVVAKLTRPLTSLSGEYKGPARVDLVPVLKRAVAAIAGPLAVKHTINLKLPPTLFALVNAERIEAVIENLVLNAVEAMGANPGTLTIEATEISGGSVMFSVTDTGPGISKTFIEQRLFRPFATTKRRGVGLGLYTCRETVKADGGSIEVDSIEGTGTTFRVVLPSAAIDRSD